MIIKMFRNYKPFAFFGIIALLLALAALGFFLPVFEEFLLTGFVERFPTLIVCGFALIASIQSFFAGLILENLRAKDRRDFEMALVRNEAVFHNTQERSGEYAGGGSSRKGFKI